jgi:GABA permease
MVMRMLAEMAVANPSTGSFADYARDALGDSDLRKSAGSRS